ncbi:MAG: ATP-binding protein [bacterium]
MWLGRGQELKTLKRIAGSDRAEFLLLYGRRRVGKSELIDRFLKSQKGIRLLAREEAEALQLKQFSDVLAERFHDGLLKTNPFTKWDAFFSYLADKAGKRIVIALDEFPYLIEANSSLPSLLQYHWDQKLRKTGIFLILCGSSIGMMETLMGSKSPLYGRRTTQMLLKPLRFADALPLLGRMREAVGAYCVFGGTPAYLVEYDRHKDLWHNIREKILSPERSLYRDAEFVLRQEVREPRAYFSIMESIAKGNTRIGHIINDTGLDKGVAAKYLGVLCDLHLVRREVPVTEKSPAKSRKGLYRLSDNFFRFWFRFVYPYIQAIEEGRQDWLMEKVIRPHMDEFIGPIFEAVAREALQAMEKAGQLPFRLARLGRWWDKEAEIDLIGIGEKDNLFCEVKWSDDIDAAAVLHRLQAKAAGTGLHGKPHFCLIARSFKQEIAGVMQLDLKKLEKLFLA